jgi:hypothetical protein
MTIQIYRHPSDIPLKYAMLVWNRGSGVGVFPHPDTGDRSRHFSSSAGACFAGWKTEMTDAERLTQFMIELWQLAAFYEIPAIAIHQAALSIPEYRDTLAREHLPEEYQHERD